MKFPKLSAVALALTSCVSLDSQFKPDRDRLAYLMDANTDSLHTLEKIGRKDLSDNYWYISKEAPSEMWWYSKDKQKQKMQNETYFAESRTFEKLRAVRPYIDEKMSLYDLAKKFDANADYVLAEEEVDIHLEQFPEKIRKQIDIRAREYESEVRDSFEMPTNPLEFSVEDC